MEIKDRGRILIRNTGNECTSKVFGIVISDLPHGLYDIRQIGDEYHLIPRGKSAWEEQHAVGIAQGIGLTAAYDPIWVAHCKSCLLTPEEYNVLIEQEKEKRNERWKEARPATDQERQIVVEPQ